MMILKYNILKLLYMNDLISYIIALLATFWNRNLFFWRDYYLSQTKYIFDLLIHANIIKNKYTYWTKCYIIPDLTFHW